MSKKRIPIEGPIPDYSTPWDDGTRAYRREQVEALIKRGITEAISGLGEKFGSAAFEAGRIVFFDEDGGRQLAAVSIAGTSYIVNIGADKPSNFYVLTSQQEALLTLAPSTQSMELGSTQREDFVEDYTYTIEVDNGNGYVDRTPSGNTIRSGGSASVNIRSYLSTGANKVRVVVTGLSSDQPKTAVFTVNLTSLAMTCDHTWHKAWIEGEEYAINGIFFSGNIAKTLHVKIGDTEYTQDFSAATQYTSVAYSFDLTNRFPVDGTGVYDVEVWMEGAEVRTDSYRYRIMCVAAAETTTARLVCINGAADKAVNYASQTLFSYATYNLTSVTLTVTANLGGTGVVIVPAQSMSVQTQTKNAYTTTLQIDTELTSGLSMFIGLSGGGAADTLSLPLDNSNAYIAAQGATFYLNPGIRANNRADRQEIHNTAPSAAVASYEAQWSNFTFADDGWCTDTDGNKCLTVMAGSTLDIMPASEGGAKLKPLATASTASLTVEWMYKAENIADYDTPVFSIMSTEEYNPAQTRGIILFPTRLLVFDSVKKNDVYQKLDLSENRVTHVAVVLQRNYANNGRNLCRIYINGRENLTYEYTGTHTDSESDYGYIRMGQQSTDFRLYMLRTYGRALEAAEVHGNYINALVESTDVSKAGEKADNNIVDGNAISYDLCKKAGFNCMVIESDYDIPSLANPEVNTPVNLRLEYNDHPEWNVVIYGAPIGGQGTTSMKYAKWNLTHKIKNACRWVYPNLTDEHGNVREETGTDGYIAGYGLHPKVSKITSKKNIASSPQGHKMGATAMYHELFAACEGLGMLPDNTCRVATYQYPFMGFRMVGDGANASYEFIGLYTVGPDKKDLKTFGYDRTSDFASLMMIEGPNHAPLMTRFLVPWTEDVTYDSGEETLTLGTGAQKQEGWDADIAAAYKTDKADQAASVLALYRSEFKPAYDAIYFTSPYIASLSEAGFASLAELNAQATEFRNSGTTNGHRNELMSFYDSSYNIVYYRYATQRYEVLPKTGEYGHDMLAYLGLSGNPTTAQILAARAVKFVSESDGVFKYVSKQEALFHECFCELLGVSDNHAKNTYWRKFAAIANGGKWGYNEDDLDTIFANDNNGQDTKGYSVEPDDTNSTGAEIFQGADSAFWYQLRQTCKADLRDKMSLMVDKCGELAARYNCTASTKYQTVINVIEHFFWAQSAKYFPATAYNEDTKYGYINVWYANPSASYNSVPPLTQIHGDHYLTEKAWVECRVAYIFSLYNLGGFKGDASDGFGTLDFTPESGFDMTVTPAIDLYPCFSVGGDTQGSERVMAGEPCVFHITGSAATNVYIKGMDWLSDLGDLSGLRLSTRGGASGISFVVAGKRLRRLLLGNAEPAAVRFNATELGVSGESLEEIDARNVATLSGTVELYNCPRLRRVDFRGTGLSEVFLPVGGRLTEVHLPSTISTLFLHSLNLLPADGLDIPAEAYANVENLYFNRCSNIDPIAFLANILQGENRLKFVTLAWEGERELRDKDDFDALANLVDNAYDPQIGEGVGSLAYENGVLMPQPSLPNIQGELHMGFGVYEDSLQVILRKLPNLQLRYDPDINFIRFADPEVERIMVERYASGEAMTHGDAMAVTTLGENLFRNNKAIRTFDELEYFGNLKHLDDRCFDSSSLESIKLPDTITTIGQSCFAGSNIESIHLPDNVSVGYALFRNCSSLRRVTGGDNALINYHPQDNQQMFYNCAQLESVDARAWRFTNCRRLSNMFYGCSNLATLDVSQWDVSDVTQMQGMFRGCSSLQSIDISGWDMSSVTNTEDMFNGCSSLQSIDISGWDMSSVTNTNSMFNGCTSLTNMMLPENMKVIGSSAFYGCSQANFAKLPDNVESIGNQAFQGTSWQGSLVIPSTLRSCGYTTFYKATGITDVTWNSSVNLPINVFNSASITSIAIAEGVTEIGANAFDNCVNLASATIPSTITRIGNYAFRKCAALTEIIIPDSVTSIGTECFNGCNAVTKLVIGSGVSEIPVRAFALVDATVTVVVRATTPPSLSSTYGLQISNTSQIYVPDASVEAYRTASVWSGYATRIHPMSELPTE